jgi:hypothetical protein
MTSLRRKKTDMSILKDIAKKLRSRPLKEGYTVSRPIGQFVPIQVLNVSRWNHLALTEAYLDDKPCEQCGTKVQPGEKCWNCGVVAPGEAGTGKMLKGVPCPKCDNTDADPGNCWQCGATWVDPTTQPRQIKAVIYVEFPEAFKYEVSHNLQDERLGVDLQQSDNDPEEFSVSGPEESVRKFLDTVGYGIEDDSYSQFEVITGHAGRAKDKDATINTASVVDSNNRKGSVIKESKSYDLSRWSKLAQIK